MEEVLAYKQKAQARKTELEAIKVKGGKDWTKQLQEELEDIVVFLVDVEDIIAEKEKMPKTYVVEKGTEDLVHLKVVKGRRFDSMTGDEVSKPYRIMLTYSEWQLFKKNFAGLGYSIMEVLHDKYGEAKDYTVKALKALKAKQDNK